jgi:hypothetical protein
MPFKANSTKNAPKTEEPITSMSMVLGGWNGKCSRELMGKKRGPTNKEVGNP